MSEQEQHTIDGDLHVNGDIIIQPQPKTNPSTEESPRGMIFVYLMVLVLGIGIGAGVMEVARIDKEMREADRMHDRVISQRISDLEREIDVERRMIEIKMIAEAKQKLQQEIIEMKQDKLSSLDDEEAMLRAGECDCE